MQNDTVAIYAASADRMDRDPYGPDGGGRAVVVNGRGWQKYRRFHPGETYVSVHDDQGREWYLTSRQALVFDFLRTYIDRGTITMRRTAEELKMAPSTVSRAVTKLVAIGILQVMVGRGRYAGMLVVKGVTGDYFAHLRALAKAKVRSWSEAAQRRLSRLEVNVAPYALEGRGTVDSLYYYLTSISITKSATLNQEWTAEDVAGVV
jgi:hypothetical protein